MSDSNTPKLEDTIRPGQRIGYNPTPETGQLLGIWVRVFDSARMGLSPWIASGELTRDETAVRAAWEETCSAMKSGRIMAGVLVRVQSYHVPTTPEKFDTRYICDAIAVDCRSAHMLRGKGAMRKNEVPDGYDLSRAVNRDVSLYLDSTDQSQDDAAKDIAHNTADSTPDPEPTGPLPYSDLPEVPEEHAQVESNGGGKKKRERSHK